MSDEVTERPPTSANVEIPHQQCPFRISAEEHHLPDFWSGSDFKLCLDGAPSTFQSGYPILYLTFLCFSSPSSEEYEINAFQIASCNSYQILDYSTFMIILSAAVVTASL
jgi:hypothetical protein